jgi:hypothetical protein
MTYALIPRVNLYVVLWCDVLTQLMIRTEACFIDGQIMASVLFIRSVRSSASSVHGTRSSKDGIPISPGGDREVLHCRACPTSVPRPNTWRGYPYTAATTGTLHMVTWSFWTRFRASGKVKGSSPFFQPQYSKVPSVAAECFLFLFHSPLRSEPSNWSWGESCVLSGLTPNTCNEVNKFLFVFFFYQSRNPRLLP